MSDNTQSTNGATVAPTQPTQDNQLTGVQARINELTANFRQTQEQLQTQAGMNQQLMEQNTQLMQQIEAMRAGGPASAPTLPSIPTDPNDPGYAAALIAHAQAPLVRQLKDLEQSVRQTVGTVGATTEQLALQQAIAGETPAVQQATLNLYKEAKQKGYTGWTPQNLLWMARGMTGTAPVARRADGSDAVLPGGASVPAPTTPVGPARKSDEEIARMSLNDRINYLDSIVGDAEIVY